MMSIINPLSGSTRKEKETEKFPVVNQSKAVNVNEVWPSPSEVKTSIERINEISTEVQAMKDTIALDKCLLNKPMIKKPRRGESGIKPIKLSITISVYSVR